MKKFIKKIRKVIGRSIPEDIKSVARRAIRSLYPLNNPSIPPEELKIFELIKNDLSIVFDVGARDDLSFYFMHKNCEYHLFEPNKKSVAYLKKEISLLENPTIKLNEFGLSDKNTDDCVYYEDSQSFVINPFNKGVDTGQRYSLKTIDEYVQENKISTVDFLKIDAEGMDYKIIQGGIQTVKNKVSYIQFEYWDGVQKFVDILGDTFNLYLMMEPRLLEAILEDSKSKMTEAQKQKHYAQSIIPLDNAVIDLIDRVLAPVGYGGNILGINKKLGTLQVEKLTFEIVPLQN